MFSSAGKPDGDGERETEKIPDRVTKDNDKNESDSEDDDDEEVGDLPTTETAIII